MESSPWLFFFFFSVIVRAFVISADTNGTDTAALIGIAASWNTKLPNWVGTDPCQDKWLGINCTGNRVTSIKLSSLGLSGTISGDIGSLSELQTLDLSNNKDMGGPLPSSIGALSNLQILILSGCSFSGEIPRELGDLSKLVSLSLNSNRFTGPIPSSLGNLTNLYWFDLADNKLTGELPVSDGTNPGLDNLTNTKHFHFGMNRLSGSIPSQIFNSHMQMIHMRFDNNYQLTGPVPGNINNLTKVAELHLENNQLTGPLPDLTGMIALSYVDMSNNSFNASDVPIWFTILPSLTSLYLENLLIGGQLPQSLFSLPEIQTLRLRGNRFNGSLTMGTNFSTQLQLIDLRDNQISDISIRVSQYKKAMMLVGNPICTQEINEKYCKSNSTVPPPYSTPTKCTEMAPPCQLNQLLSPSCVCAVPYRGTLFFRSLSFSDLSNGSYYMQLEQGMRDKFIEYNIPVDSISLHDAFLDMNNNNIPMSLEVFPNRKIQFSEQEVTDIGFMLSNQTYKPPPSFGPYYFIGQAYSFGNGGVMLSKPNKKNLGLILGTSLPAGGVTVLTVLYFIIDYIRNGSRSCIRNLVERCICCSNCCNSNNGDHSNNGAHQDPV